MELLNSTHPKTNPIRHVSQLQYGTIWTTTVKQIIYLLIRDAESFPALSSPFRKEEGHINIFQNVKMFSINLIY